MVVVVVWYKSYVEVPVQQGLLGLHKLFPLILELVLSLKLLFDVHLDVGFHDSEREYSGLSCESLRFGHSRLNLIPISTHYN